MHFDENTKLGRAIVLCNRWIRFWVKGKGIYRKTLERVIKGSKHSIGYLSTGLCNNSSSCKEKTVAVQDSSGLPLKLCLSDLCIMKVCPLRPPSHNHLSCHHQHGSILEGKPHLQWFRLPRCCVCRQVLLPTQRTDVIIHASSDFTIMLRLLQTSVPHLVGFLWLILNLDVSSPKVPETGVVLTL